MTKTPKTVADYTADEWAAMLEADREQQGALTRASIRLRQAREETAAATEYAREAARTAYADGGGAGKWEIAKRLGISRVTLDKWLG